MEDDNSSLGKLLVAIETFGRDSTEVAELLAESPEFLPQLTEVDEINKLLSLQAESDPQLVQGTQLGDFVIERYLARGGMGHIYEAVQQPLARRVAVKTIRPEIATAELRERFDRECQALGRLHTSGVIPIYAAGRISFNAETVQFLAMPFIEGQSLRAALRNPATRHCDELKQMASGTSSQSESESRETREQHEVRTARSIRQMVWFMIRLAESVDSVHASGIVHRDITPSNVMIDVKGNGWLIDFGLAQLENDGNSDAVAQDARELRDMSGRLGTRDYLAPEQVDGRAGRRTDVWGLGVVMYELLTRQAFTRSGDRASLDPATVPVVADAAPDVPDAISDVCRRALQPDYVKRYKTAQALAVDLRAWLNDEEVLARHYAPMERLRLWKKRNPRATLAFWFSLLLATAFMALGSWAWRERGQAVNAQGLAEQRRISAELSELEAVKKQKLAERRLAESLVLKGDIAVSAEDWQRARRSFVDAVGVYDNLEESPLPALSGLVRLRHVPLPLTTVPLPGEAVTAVSEVSEEQQLLVAAIGGEIQLVDVRKGRVAATWKSDSTESSGNWATSVCFVPRTNMAVAGFKDGTVQLRETASGTLVKEFHAPGTVTSLAVSPDGSHIAAGTGTIGVEQNGLLSRWAPKPRTAGPEFDGEIIVWQLESAETTAKLGGHTGTVESLDFSGDGTRLLSGSHDMSCRYWDVDNGSCLFTFPTELGPVRHAVLAPDLRIGVAMVTGNGQLFCDLHSGEHQDFEVELFNERRGLPMGLHLRSDFQTFLVSSRDGMVRRYDAATRLPGLVLTGMAPGERVGYVRHAGNAAIITVSDTAVRIWPPREEMLLPSLRARESAHAWRISADGELAFSLGRDRRLRIWSARTRSQLRLVPEEATAADRLLDVAWTEHKRIAVTGGRGLTFWNLESGQRHPLSDNSVRVTSLDVSDDGRLAVTGNADGEARLWNLEEMTEVFAIKKQHERPNEQEVSLEYIQLDDGSMVALKPDSAAVTSGSPVQRVCLSPDGQFFVVQTNGTWVISTANSNHSVELKDLAAGTCELLQFSRDGRNVLGWRRIDSAMQEVVIWDGGTGEIVRRVPLVDPNGMEIKGLATLPSGKVVLIVRQNGELAIHATDDGREIHRFNATPQPVSGQVAFSNDGSRILIPTSNSGRPGDVCYLFDANQAQRVLQMASDVQELQEDLQRNPDNTEALAGLARIFASRGLAGWADDLFREAENTGENTLADRGLAAFARDNIRGGDGATAAQLLADNSAIPPAGVAPLLWKWIRNEAAERSSKMLDARDFGPNSFLTHGSGWAAILSTGSDPSGTVDPPAVVTVGDDNRIQMRALPGLSADRVCISGDGSKLLAVDGSRQLVIVHLADGTPQIERVSSEPLPGSLTSLWLSRNASILMAGCQNGVVEVWQQQAAEWKRMHRIEPPAEFLDQARKRHPELDSWALRLEEIDLHSTPWVVHVTADESAGRFAVSYSLGDSYSGFISTGQTAGDERSLVLLREGPATAVSVSPNGKTVAAACLNGSVITFRPLDGEDNPAIKVIDQRPGTLSCIDFSADGRMLAVGGADQLARLYEATEGGHYTPIDDCRHRTAVESLAFVRNVLLTHTRAGRVVVWPTPAE